MLIGTLAEVRRKRKVIGTVADPGGGAVVPSLPFQTVLVAAGDSITAHATDNTGSVLAMNHRGFISWAQMLSGQRAFLRYNAGISGNTSAQLLARYDIDVIAKSPALVVLMIGTNTISAAGSNNTVADGCISDVQAMIAKHRAIGARTILIKILPRGLAGGASQLSANQTAAWERVNGALGIAGMAASDVTVLDLESLVGNMDAAHTMNPIYSSGSGNPVVLDYLHLNPLGSKVVGQAVASAINSSVAAGDILFQGNAASGNFNINGQMAGSVSAGAGLGALPTGYADASTPGGATYVYDLPARADAFGNDVRVTLSGTYTGTGRFIRFRRSLTITGAAVGDVYEVNGEVTVEGAIQGAISMQTQVVIDGKTLSANARSPVSAEAGAGGPWTGTLRSLPLTVATTAPTAVSHDCIVYLRDTSTTDAVSAAIRFGRLGLLKRANA